MEEQYQQIVTEEAARPSAHRRRAKKPAASTGHQVSPKSGSGSREGSRAGSPSLSTEHVMHDGTPLSRFRLDEGAGEGGGSLDTSLGQDAADLSLGGILHTIMPEGDAATGSNTTFSSGLSLSLDQSGEQNLGE